jgi:hypothetical protein
MKKILIITAIAFIIVSILAIMFTFQASSTFRNFSDDNGDNGEDHFSISDLNLIQEICIESFEELYKDIYYRGDYILDLLDLGVYFIRGYKLGMCSNIQLFFLLKMT